MAQRSCCVPGCTVKLGDGVLLHRFPNPNNPAQIERFRTWIMKIGGDIIGEDNEFIYRNRKVCHRHFEEFYIFPNMKLTALAIPSLHIPGVHVQATKGLSFMNPNINLPSTSAQAEINISLNAGVHVQAIKGLSLMNPNMNLPSTSAEPDICISSSTGVHVQATKELSFMNPNINLPSTSAQVEINISLNAERRKIPKPITATEKELKDIISETKSKLRKSQNTRRKLKMQMEMAAKLMKSSAYNSLKEKMTPAAQAFFSMQINQFAKKPTGRRFTLDEKILCLSLYKPCPKAYRLLGKMCVLPKRRTLDKVLQKINLLPGINDIIFHHLKKRTEKMDERRKYCSLIFDEMAISPNLSYDKSNDVIHGFIDNGEERSSDFCDHVCVMMIRGILRKYKQPVAFTFCKGSTKSLDLSKQIKSIIKKLTDCGLKVVATVCDQGASNMAALNILMNGTKEKYLRSGKNYKGGFFEVDSTKIYPVYDPPHLIKGIRNNLLTKDLEFKEGGKTKVASWSHIEALYRRGPGYRGVKLVNKLTAQHVIPSLIPKMRVKNCTQVFSENVGRTMGYMAEIGRLPAGSTDTADLLLFFDKMFDSVNGNLHKPKSNKIYRSGVTRRSPHHKLWARSLPILRSMKFISKSGKRGTVPSLTSWVKSIEAFVELTKYLHSVGLNSLLLRNINQDPLENFFGAIRAHGSRNIMPSAKALINSYKSLLIGNVTSYYSVGANCEDDNLNLLQSLKILLIQDVPQQKFNNSLELKDEHLNIREVNIENLITSPDNKEKCAAVAYCSGWLINTLGRKIYNDCKTCRRQLESEQIEDFHNYIKIKEFDETKTWLCYPSRDFFKYFCNVENIVIEILKTHCHVKRIAEYIELIVLMHINFNFLTCAEHKSAIIEYVVKKSIIFFINNWCKEMNQILSNKTTFWDEKDRMKVAAHNYYVKHCKKSKSNQNID